MSLLFDSDSKLNCCPKLNLHLREAGFCHGNTKIKKHFFINYPFILWQNQSLKKKKKKHVAILFLFFYRRQNIRQTAFSDPRGEWGEREPTVGTGVCLTPPPLVFMWPDSTHSSSWNTTLILTYSWRKFLCVEEIKQTHLPMRVKHHPSFWLWNVKLSPERGVSYLHKYYIQVIFMMYTLKMVLVV